jgi:hypothetical protein
MNPRTLVVLAMCVVPPALLAQASLSNQSLPPGFVDGAKNPELIPDYASYRLMLIHLASLTSIDPQTAARQSAAYSQIGLSPTDTVILQTQVSGFKVVYSQWQTEAGRSPSVAADEHVKTMVLAFRDSILKGLTTEGARKFVQFVEREKAHMIVRP